MKELFYDHGIHAHIPSQVEPCVVGHVPHEFTQKPLLKCMQSHRQWWHTPGFSTSWQKDATWMFSQRSSPASFSLFFNFFFFGWICSSSIPAVSFIFLSFFSCFVCRCLLSSFFSLLLSVLSLVPFSSAVCCSTGSLLVGSGSATGGPLSSTGFYTIISYKFIRYIIISSRQLLLYFWGWRRVFQMVSENICFWSLVKWIAPLEYEPYLLNRLGAFWRRHSYYKWSCLLVLEMNSWLHFTVAE